MQVRFLAALLVICVAFPLGSAFAGEVVIPGTGDGVAILKAIGAAFTAAHPEMPVSIPDSIGSSGGIKAVGAGEAVMARVARDIKEKERGLGLTQTPFARIPAVFFVHPGVRVSMLKAEQVAAIYAGTITNWRQLGGDDAAIVVVAREENDSTLGVLRSSMSAFAELKITPTALVETKTPLMVERVESTPNAIGFGPYDVASKNAVKVVGLDGVMPLMANYPCVTTLSLVYKQETLSGPYAAFLQFATSPAAMLPISVGGGVAL